MNTVRRPDPVATFRFLTERVAAVGARAGVTIRPYRDAELPALRALACADQRRLTADLERYLFICERTAGAGFDPNSHRLLWFALRTMGYLPPDQLFDYVRDEHVVLVNDLQHRQVFRNFAYFSVCSYTLEELYTYPWPDLYHSAQGFDDDLAQIAAAQGPLLGHVVKSTAPKHTSFETTSAFRYEISFQMAHIAGLKDRLTGRAAGYLSLSEASLVRVHGERRRGREAAPV